LSKIEQSPAELLIILHPLLHAVTFIFDLELLKLLRAVRGLAD